MIKRAGTKLKERYGSTTKTKGARLPRYFFDFRDGGRDRGFDSEGLELVNAEIAKQEAIVAVSQVMQLEATADHQRIVECRVRDSRGAEVYSVSLGYKGGWVGDGKRHVQYGSVSKIRN